MPRKRTTPKPLDTIWEVPDDLWARVLPILQDNWKPSPKGGQPPKDWRPLFNGILHRLRSGCQWNHHLGCTPFPPPLFYARKAVSSTKIFCPVGKKASG